MAGQGCWPMPPLKRAEAARLIVPWRPAASADDDGCAFSQQPLQADPRKSAIYELGTTHGELASKSGVGARSILGEALSC